MEIARVICNRARFSVAESEIIPYLASYAAAPLHYNLLGIAENR